MASIDPRTNLPRYVDLRAALADGKVTGEEVGSLMTPHYRNTDSWVDGDQEYSNILRTLAHGELHTGRENTVVQVDDDAKRAIDMIFWLR